MEDKPIYEQLNLLFNINTRQRLVMCMNNFKEAVVPITDR